MQIKIQPTLWFSILLISVSSLSVQADTLSEVRNRGELNCGVPTALLGFSALDKNQHWSGFFIDFCRAVAAATLGDSEKVNYIKFDAVNDALASHKPDVLSYGLTWTLLRDTAFGLKFVGVHYYDGQGVLVKKSANINTFSDLNNRNICVSEGTTSELNFNNYAKENKIKHTLLVKKNLKEAKTSFEQGACDAITADRSSLQSIRAELKHPNSSAILFSAISREPLSPSVKQGDEKWFNIVRWSLNAMIAAEDLGITMSNVDEPHRSNEANRLLGNINTKSKSAQNLGLDEKWAYNIIKQVGNYADSFERNFTNNTKINARQRGLNALWKNGGILYSPSF
jgi:general L-amino acid transport system substrate-binding protein